MLRWLMYCSMVLILVKEKHKEAIQLLVQHGAKINSQTEVGETPLHIATKNNAKDMIEELLLAKADVNLRRNDGCSALHIAG